MNERTHSKETLQEILSAANEPSDNWNSLEAVMKTSKAELKFKGNNNNNAPAKL